MQHEHVQIYTQQWRDDAPISTDDEETPTAHLHGRVFIDGKELVCALGAVINSRGGEFTTVTLTLSPGKVEWIPLTEEEWEALGK